MLEISEKAWSNLLYKIYDIINKIYMIINLKDTLEYTV